MDLYAPILETCWWLWEIIVYSNSVSLDFVSNGIVFSDRGAPPIYIWIYICKFDNSQNIKKNTKKKYICERGIKQLIMETQNQLRQF